MNFLRVPYVYSNRLRGGGGRGGEGGGVRRGRRRGRGRGRRRGRGGGGGDLNPHSSCYMPSALTTRLLCRSFTSSSCCPSFFMRLFLHLSSLEEIWSIVVKTCPGYPPED